MTLPNNALFALILMAALGSGLIAGVFFAFSNFVMKALASLPPEKGIAAMQAINVTVLNPVFLGVFVGSAVLCVPGVILALLRWHAPGSCWLLAGSLLYFVGTATVTGVCNVPRNNALAAVDPASAAGAELWRDYLIQWTFWNHMRTVAALAACGAFIVALRQMPSAAA